MFFRLYREQAAYGQWPLLDSTALESDNANAGEHMKTSWPKVSLLVLCCAALGFEVWRFRSSSAPTTRSSESSARTKPPDFSLLPASEVSVWSKYFAPGSHANSWEPTLGDMNGVEAALPQITALSNTDPDLDRHIENPSEYYRQYLALQINGKKKLILNAMCSVDHDANWRKHFVVVRDGGKCFWHAVYDLSTGNFSDLSVNGQG